MEEVITQEFIKWVKENHLHLFIKEYVNVAMSYLYADYYEHYYDGNPYDFSGEIKNTYIKNIDKVSTLNELVNCYTGERIATFTSNYGWYFITVGDSIRNAMNDIYTKLIYDYVRLNPSTFGMDETKIIDDDEICELLEDFDYMYVADYAIYEIVEKILGIIEESNFN